MSSLDQLCETIDARIAELYREMATLRAARAALHDEQNGNGHSADVVVVVEGSLGHRAQAARPSRPRSRARAKRSGSDQAGEALLAGRLEAMLGEAEDGLSAITISKRSQAGYSKVRDLLRELERAGQVRRTGTRRTSLWRLITDEERIAARTAELENL